MNTRRKSGCDKAPNVRTFLISEDETATIVQATFIEHKLEYDVVFEFIQNRSKQNAISWKSMTTTI